MSNRRAATAFGVGLLLLAWATAAGAQARVLPPPQADCPRDKLTLYSGTPLRYARQPGHTDLVLRTDWDTTETVRVLHPGSDDPSPWFLLARQPFQAADWARIELRRGQLRPGLKVAVWICEDGRNPLLDWQPPVPR